jgi:hypothetical protein
MFLADLLKRLLQRGYEDVRVVPQMFVVKGACGDPHRRFWLSDRIITIEDAPPSDQIKI